jgi:hypothetical protein
MEIAIRPRERDAILQSLRAGVVPHIGLQHIQVDRKDEVAAILNDLDRIAQDGGAAIRFIIGRYGSGKSFFLNLARIVALEKKFVVVQADITPGRRLHGSSGEARSLYSELMHNMSAGAKRDGGALPGLVERWVSDVEFEVGQTGLDPQEEIYKRLKPLEEYVSCYDFATVINKYVEGSQQGNDALMSASLRWLRAEYTTKTEARQDLGVRSIIGDQDIYDYLKLMAAFVKLAGYAGLLVNLDEMGVLAQRLNNKPVRDANYGVILDIVNDCLQGTVKGLDIIFAGTDIFMDDGRRGIVSNEALKRRLTDNRFAKGGLRDCSGPVIRLQNLTPEDLYVLLLNIRHVYAKGDPSCYLVPDEALNAYIQHCSRILGAEFYQTPGDAVKGFIGLLSVLEQNPDTDWKMLLSDMNLQPSKDPDSIPMSEDELTTFHL